MDHFINLTMDDDKVSPTDIAQPWTKVGVTTLTLDDRDILESDSCSWLNDHHIYAAT